MKKRPPSSLTPSVDPPRAVMRAAAPRDSINTLARRLLGTRMDAAPAGKQLELGFQGRLPPSRRDELVEILLHGFRAFAAGSRGAWSAILQAWVADGA
jgi:hypothetical protein